MAGLATTLLVGPAAAQQPPVRSALAMPGKRGLAQRVICGRSALLMPRPGAPSGSPQPPLRVFYVYGRQRAQDQVDWLEVGRAPRGATDGWIRADLAVRWDHNLSLTYAPRSALRERVLYFGAREEVRALLGAADRAQRARSLAAQAAAGSPGPVIALEPAIPLDPATRFHLLAVLDSERMMFASRATATVLEVAALTTSEDGAPLVPPPGPSSVPTVTSGWTTDIDLVRDDRRPFDVGALVTRRQLADFAGVVRAILAQADGGVVRPAVFFDRVRGASATMARDPAQLRSREAAGFSDAQELIDGLPYLTQAMDTTTEDWLASSVFTQAEHIDRIRQMLAGYVELGQRRDGWFAPDGGTRDEDLILLPLGSLP